MGGGLAQQQLNQLTRAINEMRGAVENIPVLSRPATTQLGAISPPSIYRATRINVNIALGGGTATLLAGLSNRIREVVGGYVRQTAGAARNFQIEITDGTAAPISDNNTNSKALQGIIHIRNGDTLQINAVAAADQGTWTGWLFHNDVGFSSV